VRTHEHQHCADRFTVADDHAVDPADFARFGLNAQPARGTDKSHGAFVSGARDLKRR
jgi:hypothetical protein